MERERYKRGIIFRCIGNQDPEETGIFVAYMACHLAAGNGFTFQYIDKRQWFFYTFGLLAFFPVGFCSQIFCQVGCLPIGIVGLVSGKYQGMTSAAAIGIIAKREDQFGKAMLFPAMVETYAILALLTSVLVITNVPV